MLLSIKSALQEHLRVVISGESSRQMAAGLGMGILLGLVPPYNLLSVVLWMVLFASRMNLTVAITTALAVSWIGWLLDPITHQIGYFLLSLEILRPLWTELYHQPLAPWTGWNNTVVLGNAVLGGLLAPAGFAVSQPLFERFMPVLGQQLKQYAWFRWLAGYRETPSEPDREPQPQEAAAA